MGYTKDQLMLLKIWMKEDNFFKKLDIEEQKHIHAAYWNLIHEGDSVVLALQNIRKKWILYLHKYKGVSWMDIDNMIRNDKKETV